MTTLPTSPVSVLRRGWRWLRTMRTAIILLFILAAGSAVGTLIPQRPNTPASVDAWKLHHAAWAGIAEHAGLFDVFGSWWFTGIYILLLVSVAGCLVPRYRAFARALRARPKMSATLNDHSAYRHAFVRNAPAEVLDMSSRMLRRRRFRIARNDTWLAAERGLWREGGSLVFHSAFYLLIVGIFLARGFGFTGQALVVEGNRFTETHVGYDYIKEGRFFGERHRGFQVALDSFAVDWYPNQVPKEFASSVRIFDGDREVRAGRIRVNSPMNYRGVTIYQASWGWAPRIQVVQHGKVLFDDYVVFLQNARSMNWHGVVKAPAATPFQLGLDMYFFSDPSVVNGVPFNASPYPRSPFIFAQEYRGDLGLSVPQSVYDLDKTNLAPGDVAGVGLGKTYRLKDGIEIRFPQLRKYSVLQLTSNPGAWPLFIAAMLILAGLVPALYAYRRRVWIRVVPHGELTHFEIAGTAAQRRDRFEEEYAALINDLATKLSVVPKEMAPVPVPIGE